MHASERWRSTYRFAERDPTTDERTAKKKKLKMTRNNFFDLTIQTECVVSKWKLMFINKRKGGNRSDISTHANETRVRWWHIDIQCKWHAQSKLIVVLQSTQTRKPRIGRCCSFGCLVQQKVDWFGVRFCAYVCVHYRLANATIATLQSFPFNLIFYQSSISQINIDAPRMSCTFFSGQNSKEIRRKVVKLSALLCDLHDHC